MYSLSEIWIYPIKSLGGIRLAKTEIGVKGLEGDREFMLVDESGNFISQRNHPKLNQLTVSIEKDVFVVTDKRNGNQLSILKNWTDKYTRTAQIWNDLVEVIKGDPTIDVWFSDFLTIPCTLVYLPKNASRQVDLDYAPIGTETTLTDGFPFLIIGQEALNNLNNKLAKPVEMTRFRPNLVFTGGHAHDEDNWDQFQIGKATFKRVKPCARCLVTTLDLETSQPGKEPLKTLATYRRQNNKIYFGQNLISQNLGTLKVGDPIQPIL